MLDAPPEREDVLSDDIGVKLGIALPEAIEVCESSIPATLWNPDGKEIANRPAPQYGSTM